MLNFWCNTNGQIVYLLYRSADDILVAYANDANSGDNGIVIPTANVPTPGTHTDENADRNGNAVADADGYTRTSRFSRANQNLLLRR